MHTTFNSHQSAQKHQKHSWKDTLANISIISTFPITHIHIIACVPGCLGVERSADPVRIGNDGGSCMDALLVDLSGTVCREVLMAIQEPC